MRSFLLVSLAVMAGCGGDVVDDEGTPTGDHGFGDGVDTSNEVIGKLVPQVCSARAWNTAFIEDKNVQLRAVPVAQGTAVLGVPLDGGSLYGFVIDARGQIIGDPNGTKVLGGNFSALSATRQDDRLIAAVVEGTKVQVHILKDDLSNTYLLDTVGGANLVSDTTIIKSRGHRLTVSGGVDGIISTQFDLAWSPMGADVFARDVPTSISSAAYGTEEALVAWSTEHQCNLARVSANHVTTRDFACDNTRLAANYATKSAQMVYESAGAVNMADIMVGTNHEIDTTHILAAAAHAPRIVFDGQRYWVSYINTHNDITLGYLDEDNHFVSVAIPGVHPMAQAYDLAVINGSVWLYAVDGDAGYTGTRMCLVRERT